MIKISTKQRRTTGKLLKKLIAAAALGACSLAQAEILNFEQPVDIPVMFTGQHTQFGAYWIETYGGQFDYDSTGMIVDGRDSDTCMGVGCPVNNTSHYYASLNDNYFYFGLNSDRNFRVSALQASFIGAGQSSFPATSGLLVLQGYNAAGVAVGSGLQLGLAGPNAKGEFNFANYTLSASAFGNTTVNYVRVLGYACDASLNCVRNTDYSNFAIDNIETVTVPEPTTLALFGLGIAGAVFARRRRA